MPPIKNKKKFSKIVGGQLEQQVQPVQPVQQISQSSTESRHSGLMGLFNLVIGILMKGINIFVDKTSKLLKIDTSSNISVDMKKTINDKLTEINEILKDPATQEKIGELVKILREKGEIIVEAAKPAAKKAFYNAIEIMTEASTKMGQSAVKVGLDVAGIVPVVGEIIEGVRVVDDVVKAAQASIIAAADMVETGSDAVADSLENYKKISSSETIPTTIPTNTTSKQDELLKLQGGNSLIKNRILKSILKFNKTNTVHKHDKKNKKNKKNYTKKRVRFS